MTAPNLRPQFDCDHERVKVLHRTVERGLHGVGNFLRQTAHCLDCGCIVVRVTEVMTYGKWAVERGVAKR